MDGADIKAVVVLSGGQDSATCLALAVRKHGADHVAAITFRYGQRHALETKFARGLARHFGIARHNVVSLGFYRQLTTNALLDPTQKIARRKGSACPTTVVEGRNAFFLLAAAVWAKSLGATEVYTGVSEADYSGYPDCRAAFIRSQQRTIRLALEWPVRIVTPFLHKTKAQEWALADKLGVFELVRDRTLTCYNGVPGAGCGMCPACKLRNDGLAAFLAGARRTVL
jgi:7-cyano-7-deazaguanine synthase